MIASRLIEETARMKNGANEGVLRSKENASRGGGYLADIEARTLPFPGSWGDGRLFVIEVPL